MSQPIGLLWYLLRTTVSQFVSRGGPLLGAALAFYTILSVAPLLLVILACTSWALSHMPSPLQPQEWDAAVQIPLDAASSAWVRGLLDNLRQSQAQAGAGVIGTLLLWYSGTRLFVQLQQALNQLWQIRPDPSGVKAGVFATIKDQAAAVLMVFLVAASLTVAVASSTALGAVRGALQLTLPGSELAWSAGGLALNLGILGTLFALLLRILPAARLAATDLAVGAAATALLLGLLEYPLSFYLGYQGIESAFGAAGSLIAFLLWVYYSAQIFLFGAQFTQVWATTVGRGLVLTPDAKHVAPVGTSRKEPQQKPQTLLTPIQDPAGPSASKAGAEVTLHQKKP